MFQLAAAMRTVMPSQCKASDPEPCHRRVNCWLDLLMPETRSSDIKLAIHRG